MQPSHMAQTTIHEALALQVFMHILDELTRALTISEDSKISTVVAF